MKLIACLLVLSLIFVSWSSALTSSTVWRIPGDDPELEQFQSHQLLKPDWWSWEIWSEWLTLPRRRRSWRKLRHSLYKFKRWYHRRVRKVMHSVLCTLKRQGRRIWQGIPHLWQLWPETVGEASDVKPLAESIRSCILAQEQCSQKIVPTPSPLLAQEEAPQQPEKQGQGRPRTIPTNHRCCPHKTCSSYGILGPHPDHDIIGAGTYPTSWGETRQMYECKVCGKTFSETAGTPLHHLKTPKERVIHACKDLAEGLGVRATARVNDVDKDTILRWLKRVGQHCQQVSEYTMQGLELTQLQMDELWTLAESSAVRKKQKRLSEWEKEHTQQGDTWIWTTFDPGHKLVPTILVGKRTEEEAKGLLAQLKERLAEGVLPLFTSDSLAHYAKAILHVFGKWVQPERKGDRGRFPKPRPVAQDGLQYATVHKEREKGHVVSVTIEVIYGTWDEIRARLEAWGQTVNTSYVERENLTLRHLVSRLHRKSLCFSKKRECLEYHLHLVLAYYHFVLYHSSLRERLPEPIPTRGDGSPKIWRQQTPAMSAGLTDHQWTMEELLMFQAPAGP